MREQGDVMRYLQAAALLPPHLRRRAQQVDKAYQAVAEELRLRAGRPMTVVCPQGERLVPDDEPVQAGDLNLVVEIATRASAHTAMEQVRSGYFTVSGGHRIGICGICPHWPSVLRGRCRGHPPRWRTSCGREIPSRVR